MDPFIYKYIYLYLLYCTSFVFYYGDTISKNSHLSKFPSLGS